MGWRSGGEVLTDVNRRTRASWNSSAFQLVLVCGAAMMTARIPVCPAACADLIWLCNWCWMASRIFWGSGSGWYFMSMRATSGKSGRKVSASCALIRDVMQETARAANFVQALVVGQCFEQRAMPSLEAQAALFELRIKLSEIKLDLKIGGLPEYVLGPGDRAG